MILFKDFISKFDYKYYIDNCNLIQGGGVIYPPFKIKIYNNIIYEKHFRNFR
jgi:hypothetical protein